MEPICPQCHVPVKATDFYCYNCGKNLKEKPLAVSLFTEIMYYVGSIALPPLGLVWGFKFLRQTGPVARRIAIISIVLTVISSIVTVVWSLGVINGINTQMNSELKGIPGL